MSPSSARLQKRIVGLVIFFLLVGQVMLFSATGVPALERYGNEFYFLTRQAICAVVGLILMFLFSRIRYHVWARLAYLMMTVQVILVAATLFSHFGHHAQGASRWLRIGPLSFQPSEMAKITATIFLAHGLSLRSQGIYSRRGLFFQGGYFLLLLFLIFKQPDLGSVVLLLCMALAIFFIAGAKPVYLLSVLGAGSVLFIFSMLHTDYRRRRLLAFLNPWADPQGSGFQSIQSFLSFHSGKFFGVGIGNGNSKLFFLPEVHTDFIYALIGEELGFIGAIVLLVLFIYFGYLLFKVVLKAPDPFGCYLAFGLALSILLQIAVNLGGVTGIVPVKGLPLPFISWGRSALLVNLATVGILLNIVRQSGIIAKPKQ